MNNYKNNPVPNVSQDFPTQNGEKKSNVILIVVIVIVLTLIAAGVLYFLFSGNDKAENTAPTSAEKSEDSENTVANESEPETEENNSSVEENSQNNTQNNTGSIESGSESDNIEEVIQAALRVIALFESGDLVAIRKYLELTLPPEDLEVLSETSDEEFAQLVDFMNEISLTEEEIRSENTTFEFSDNAVVITYTEDTNIPNGSRKSMTMTKINGEWK